MCRKQSEDAEVPGLSVWHSTVHIMRADIVTWIAKQSKHAAVGYPFVTMLLCLEEDITFNAYVDPQMDHLQRQFKVQPDMMSLQIMPGHSHAAPLSHHSASSCCECLRSHV
jgi:hypothetical protein